MAMDGDFFFLAFRIRMGTWLDVVCETSEKNTRDSESLRVVKGMDVLKRKGRVPNIRKRKNRGLVSRSKSTIDGCIVQMCGLCPDLGWSESEHPHRVPWPSFEAPVPLKGHPLPLPTGLQCSIKKYPSARFHPSTISIIQHPSSHPSRASPSHPYAGPVIH